MIAITTRSSINVNAAFLVTEQRALSVTGSWEAGGVSAAPPHPRRPAGCRCRVRVGVGLGTGRPAQGERAAKMRTGRDMRSITGKKFNQSDRFLHTFFLQSHKHSDSSDSRETLLLRNRHRGRDFCRTPLFRRRVILNEHPHGRSEFRHNLRRIGMIKPDPVHAAEHHLIKLRPGKAAIRRNPGHFRKKRPDRVNPPH